MLEVVNPGSGVCVHATLERGPGHDLTSFVRWYAPETPDSLWTLDLLTQRKVDFSHRQNFEYLRQGGESLFGEPYVDHWCY